MPHLKDLIEELPDLSSIVTPVPPYRLEKAKTNIAMILGDTTPREPSSYDLMETYDVLLGTHHDVESFLKMPTKHLKRAPWVMFEPPKEGAPVLANSEDILLAYLGCLKRRLFGPAIIALAMVFLRYYPQHLRFFDLIRERIPKLLAELKTPKGRSLQERSKKYGFFWKNGPQKFSKELFESEDIENTLALAGFDAGFIDRGFVQASVKEVMLAVCRGLNKWELKEEKLNSLLEFFEQEVEDGRKLRFPSLRGELADALLLPYIEYYPESNIQKLINDFLLKYYSDPRINRGNWHAVNEEALNVFMQWLVHATLEDFFRVVRKGSHQDYDADRMWPYREAFWSAYLQKGVITDAWVILGKGIAHTSRRFLSEQANTYGKFERGSGVKSVHAALIMRIGELIITEWNHSGKYRIWHSNQQEAPAFYQSHYSREDLVHNPDYEKAHSGAENGNWQGHLASYIAEWTGIRVTYQEYMPK